MNLIAVAIIFTCYFFVVVTGLATCGVGIWADTTCVELSECWQYLHPKEQFREIDVPQHTSFVMNSIQPAMCGFTRNIPRVCCPDEQLKNPPANCGGIIWNKRLSPDGTPADLEEFPWLALLAYETPNGTIFGCGGVLISDRHVLTAAHCLGLSENKLIGVRLGEHDLRTAQDCIYDPLSVYCSKAAVDVGIEQEIPHESYSFLRGPMEFDPLSYDIAILKLDRSVTTDVIKPICLPEWPDTENFNLIRSNVFEKYLSAGWGAKLDTDYPKSYVKLMSRLKGVNKNYCDDQYGQILQDDIICALSRTSQTACVADSGGPLMGFNSQSRMTVTGIYSPVDNQPCQKNGIPSTFVDVRQYVDWILWKMYY